MSFQVVVTEGVYEELNEAATYYEDRQSDLGNKFIDDWESTLEFLGRNPLGFQTNYKEFRCVYFDRFPFLIVYKVEESNIIIYRVIHVKKHPGKRFAK